MNFGSRVPVPKALTGRSATLCRCDGVLSDDDPAVSNTAQRQAWRRKCRYTSRPDGKGDTFCLRQITPPTMWKRGRPPHPDTRQPPIKYTQAPTSSFRPIRSASHCTYRPPTSFLHWNKPAKPSRNVNQDSPILAPATPPLPIGTSHCCPRGRCWCGSHLIWTSSHHP